MLLAEARLKDFEPESGAQAGAFLAGYDDHGWMPVTIPGDVHRALVEAGRISEPFYDRNESAVGWVADREWWFRIAAPALAEPLGADERLRLTFNGLDTLAQVWLNGEPLGEHRNMFRPAVFDVSVRWKSDGPNLLAVCLSSITAGHIAPGESLADLRVRDRLRFPLRKNQVGFGWDISSVLLTVGIWRPVDLRREHGATLAGVRFRTVELGSDHQAALVAVSVGADRITADRPLTAVISLRSPEGEPVAHRELDIRPGQGTPAETYLHVTHPRLWWTHDLGESALYALTVTLCDQERELDSYHAKVGIRTLELDQSPDQAEPGSRFFRFLLNGVPIFARGANTVPPDLSVGCVDDARYEQLVRTARDANMNMLRVWGGGIYNPGSFYAACDVLGLLVWQDFMLSGEYDDNDTVLLGEVAEEARYQVARLRNHPSIALWCGNNESQYQHAPGTHQAGAFVLGEKYFGGVLPRAVAELAPDMTYWPGSPYGGNPFNSKSDGDTHDWRGWHGDYSFQPFGEEPPMDRTGPGRHWANYAQNVGRFVSEFGFVGAPNVETLRRWIPADQLVPYSPAVDHRNKDEPTEKGNDLMRLLTGLPTTIEDFVDFSMMIQAEGVKFGIESFRRRKPHCSGALLWQLNDCWPGQSWSLVDYEGFAKASYFYTRRAFAAVMASFRPLPDGGLELWVTNDTLSEVVDGITVAARSFSGVTRWEEHVRIVVAANTSVRIRAWKATETGGGPDCYASVRSEAGTFPRNRHFFAHLKDLTRWVRKPSVTMSRDDDRAIRVQLLAKHYAYFVKLSTPDSLIRYSDNYFDLEPGERRTVIVSHPERHLDPAAVSVRSR